ncbi:MAG: 1-acyl-sn-glycerol-3-phosphate acyltransferase [Proteobacteria bacterium]|nr:1-acyl-sn-glycerol-3-phosphate acyltransferase [Pseudomonadota bacterium]
MNAVIENAMPRRDLLRPLRYLLRVPLLLLHVLIAPPMVLLVFSPLGARLRVGDERLDHWATRWWSGALIRRFGFRIRRIGEPLPGATLFVANHVSWMDIELMHSQRMMSFVAKSEIARWPLVGWLATRAGTIYHRRGSTQSLGAVMQCVVTKLAAGDSAGVFPEGGTGPGDQVRTFHARIFQVAADAHVPIQPVALRYGRHGKMDLSVPFAARESFFANVVRLLGGPSGEAEVHFLEPLVVGEEGRRQIAEAARARIARALGQE